MANKPTTFPANKLWQLNQQYFQPKSYDKSTNIISGQNVMANQPTIFPAKKLWQLNKQYIQLKCYGSSKVVIIAVEKNTTMTGNLSLFPFKTSIFNRSLIKI